MYLLHFVLLLLVVLRSAGAPILLLVRSKIRCTAVPLEQKLPPMFDRSLLLLLLDALYHSFPLYKLFPDRAYLLLLVTPKINVWRGTSNGLLFGIGV